MVDIINSIQEKLSSVWEGVKDLAEGVKEAVIPGELEGQASGSTLGQSKYDFKYLTFPEDLGTDYVGHYMVININVPTEGFKLTNGLDVRSPAGQFTNLFTPLSGSDRQVSKVDTLRYGNTGLSSGNKTIFSIPRQTRRIAESIALFMPSGLVYTDQSAYQDIEMSSYGGTAATAALTAAAGVLLGVDGANKMAQYVDQFGQAVSSLSQVMGNPINPGVEVLFSTKVVREFAFDFLFAPRNEKESLNLKSIIKTLRFHASPEINTIATGGYLGATWIPPADFDITFFKHGIENTNIMRINTCILHRIDVDYNPAGAYSTFTNGHPVTVRMTLHFKEVEPIHKARVVAGF